MARLELYSNFRNMSGEEYIKNFLIYNASLVIAEARPSVTVTINISNEDIKKSWSEFGAKFLLDVGLKYTILRQCEKALILLIYDERLLEDYITKEKNKKFLRYMGYSKNTKTVSEYLKVLKLRYDECNCPHELGIFLGFPLSDVVDFIQNSDKKCLLCGYWKVYNNLDFAQRAFENYDEIKKYTVDSISKGVREKALVQSIKQNFNFKM